MTGSPAERRAAYIEGLRRFADLLETRPDLRTPAHGDAAEARPHALLIHDAADILADALGRPVTANADADAKGDLWLVWHIAGIAVQTIAYGLKQQVTGVRVIGGREVPVTEIVIPERFQPEKEPQT